MNLPTRITTLDLPSVFPQLGRATIGFERLFNELQRRTVELPNQSNYPPYNVVKHSDSLYTIEVAVAGFKREELEIVLNNNTLTISGAQERDQSVSTEYLYQGISARHFERTFTLAEHVSVKSAEVIDGILVVAVEYIVPEDKKARIIEIK